MLRGYSFAIVSFVALASVTAFADLKEDIQTAIQNFTKAGNYHWTTTVTSNDDREAGEIDGKVQNDLVYVQEKINSPVEFYAEGGRVVIRTADGWITPSEPIRASKFVTPLQRLRECLNNLQNPQKTSGGYAGDLPPAIAEKYIAEYPPDDHPIGDPPDTTVTEGSGSIYISIQDGNLAGIELHLTGSLKVKGSEPRKVDRTLTTKFSDIGNTSIEIPDEVKAKFASK